MNTNVTYQPATSLRKGYVVRVNGEDYTLTSDAETHFTGYTNTAWLRFSTDKGVTQSFRRSAPVPVVTK